MSFIGGAEGEPVKLELREVKWGPFTLYRVDDWVGLYKDGKLVYEGHSIDLDQFFYQYPEYGQTFWLQVHNLDPSAGRMPQTEGELMDLYGETIH